MREPLFTVRNQAARLHEVPDDPESHRRSIEAAALYRATNLAIESAFKSGVDLPIGAVALDGDEIVGRGFANDNRLGYRMLHAEVMSLLDTKFDIQGGKPRTVVVTAEPCQSCQDALAYDGTIERVAFGLSRTDLADLGLVKPHDETIFERAARIGLPYEVALIDDEQLRVIGLTILGNVSRDVDSGNVTVDGPGLTAAIIALNEA